MRGADSSKNGIRKAVHPYRRRFRLIDVGRFSDAMPAGENTCGVHVEASGAGEIGISFLELVRWLGFVVDGKWTMPRPWAL